MKIRRAFVDLSVGQVHCASCGDTAAYRRDVLARTLAMLRHAGLWRPPA